MIALSPDPCETFMSKLAATPFPHSEKQLFHWLNQQRWFLEKQQGQQAFDIESVHHYQAGKHPVWWLLFRGPSKKRRELEAPSAEAPAINAKAALGFIKPGAATEPIGDAPGVYDAPEVKGIYWPQVLLTLALGTTALAIGYVIVELIAR